jgi:hypothetical protein
MNGRSLRPRARDTQEETDRKRAVRTYRYGDAWDCSERPQGLQISYKRGPGVRFLNPTPTRRKHLLLGWLPEFRYVPGPPRKVKRVRQVGSESEGSYPVTRRVDARPSLSRGQALRGDDIAGVETPSYTVIPAKAGIQDFSHGLPGKLPPPLEGVTKNQVRTKLECSEESMVCYDSSNRRVEMAIATPGEGPQGGFDGPDLNGQNLDGRAPSLPSCDVTFAEEESWMFMAPDDHDWEVCEASHALIELQWSRWRLAVSDSSAAAT